MRARLLRPVAGAIAAAAVALTVAACPSRDLDVQVTTDGAGTLVLACESFRNACATQAACERNRFLCTQDTCQLRQVCHQDQSPDWAPEQAMGMRLLLLQLGAGPLTIKNASACVPVNLRPCILDVTGKVGCPCIQSPLGTRICTDPSGENALSCIRDTLTLAVQAAIGSGISFSGFTSTDNVALVAAFYEKPSGEAPCDAGVLVNPSDCVTANLTAVAGMGAPAGSSTYDITCASCQDGPHTSYGPDNAPCPVTDDACFLQSVAAALVAGGM